MDRFISKTAPSIIRIVSLIAVICMVAISFFVYKAPALSILLFVCFIIIYVQLPGLYLLRLAGVFPDHISTQLTLGLFAGWAAEVLMYFVSDAVPTDLLLYSTGPILSLLLMIDLRKHKGIESSGLLVHKLKFSRLSASMCIFFALSFLFILLKTQYVYLAPEYCDFIYMNPDKAYHMGLINSLASDYPLQSPWIQGRFVKYHIFTEVLYCLPLRLFGVTSDVILSSCGPLLTVYAVCISLYSLFTEMCSRKDRAGLYCLFLLLSNIFIARGIDRSIALLFVYKNENTAGFGVAGSIAAILMLNYWYKEYSAGRPHIKQLLLLTALLMLATGLKGPMGAVFIAAVWGTYILGLILKQVKPALVLPILVMTAGFLVVYMTVLGMKGQSNGSGDSTIAMATISDICFWKEPLIAFLKSEGMPNSIRFAAVLFVFMVFMLTAFFLPFCIGYIRDFILIISKKKPFDFTRVVIYAAITVGTAAMFILNYAGHSQIYFGLLAVFLAPAVAFWLIEDLEKNKSDGLSTGRLCTVLIVLFFCTLVLTSISLGINYCKNFEEAVSHADPTATYNKYLSISNNEYEAMRWIDENTPKDSLLATDRYYSVDLNEYAYDNRWANRFFLYAVYADRFCYIAGSGYNLGPFDYDIRMDMVKTNKQLYDAENEDRDELAEELGIDYVVVSKRFTDVGDLSGEGYELCYSNPDIDIYETGHN